MDNAQRLGWFWCELMEIYGFQNKAGIRQYPEHQPSAMLMRDAPQKSTLAKLRAQVQNMQSQSNENQLHPQRTRTMTNSNHENHLYHCQRHTVCALRFLA